MKSMGIDATTEEKKEGSSKESEMNRKAKSKTEDECVVGIGKFQV